MGFEYGPSRRNSESPGLLTPELRSGLPRFYAQGKTPDPIAHAKFFTPDSSSTWYVTEGEPDSDDFRFFGYVAGFVREWGYFLLSELESVRGPLKLLIERDLYFTPGPFSEVMKAEGRTRGK